MLQAITLFKRERAREGDGGGGRGAIEGSSGRRAEDRRGWICQAGGKGCCELTVAPGG